MSRSAHSSIGRRWPALVLAALITGAVSLPTAEVASAATITVTSTADITANDGVCTLREAITAADTNTASGGAAGECPAGSAGSVIDTVVLQAGATYRLLQGDSLFVQQSPVAVLGNGAIIESDPARPNNTILQVLVGAELSLTTVTIRNASAGVIAGGVYVDDLARLTVSGSTFANNRAQGGGNVLLHGGGAIFNRGELTVTDSTFTGNVSTFGGAIKNFATGRASVTNTTFTGNRADNSFNADGGAIDNLGAMTVTGGVFTENTALRNGGAIHNSSLGQVATLTLTGATFTGNRAGGAGGGLYNGGNLTLVNSSVNANVANGSGGGFANGPYATFQEGPDLFENGKLTVSGTTVSNNRAPSGGGGGNGGRLALTNSTISGNLAGTGAGLFNTGALTLTNVTIATNRASSQAGGVFVQTSADLSATNTLIAGNIAEAFGAGQSADCLTPVLVGHHNLVGSGTGCPATGAGTRTIAPGLPAIGPLAANGGPTQTHALVAFSPALDAGDAATCAAAPVNNASQNGVTRPAEGDGVAGAVCDIGAVEMATVPTAGALTWYFAEGYTGDGFDTYLTIQNPNPIAAQITITYYLTGVAPMTRTMTAAANSRVTIAVHDPTQGVGRGQAVSAKVASTNGVGIIVERPIYFTYGAGITGGHIALGATAPRAAWYFAEGYTGTGFDQYLTILNPNASAAAVTITYYLAGGPPVVKTLSVPATARHTVAVHETSQGVGRGQAVAAKVETSHAGGVVVERPMYFTYEGSLTVREGHNAMGAAAPQSTWYFPDGSTATGVDTFLTILNPNGTAANVTITYSLATGAVRTQTVSVPATARATVAVHEAGQGIGRNQTVSITVETSHAGGIVVERSAYATSGATIVLGSSAARPAWYFAEGYTGTGFTQELIVFNPSATATTATITYFLANGQVTTIGLPLAARGRAVVVVNDPLTGVGPGQAVSARVDTASVTGIVAERVMRFRYNGVIPGAHAVVGYAP